MTSNGSVSYEQRPGPPVGPELGSAIGADRVFGYWSDNRWLTPIAVDDRMVDNMLRLDGRAQTIAQVLTLPMRGVDWSIEPAKGDSGEAEWTRERFTAPADEGGMRTPFPLVISQLTGASLYKRAYFEKVVRLQTDGTAVWDKLAWRPPASCQLAVSGSGDPAGFRQRAWKGGQFEQVDIPAVRSMVHVNQQHRRPLDGVSDLETAYVLFEYRQKLRFLWYSGLENHALPKAVAKGHTNDQRMLDDLALRVATLKSGGVIAIGPDDDVTPYPAGTVAEFEQAMNSLASEMAQSVLAGFVDLTSGATGTGSYALSKDATDFFLQSRHAALGELETTITHQAFAPLVRWAFGPGGKTPLMRFGSLVQEAAGVAVEMLTALASAPSLTVLPQAFLDELTEKVAALLGLDVAPVRAEIERRVQSRSSPAGQLQEGIAAAAQLVSQAGAPAAQGATPAVAA